MSDIEDIRARWQAATPGPWSWRGNTGAHTIDLLAHRSAWGDVVMDFQRWGMRNARPCFCTDGLIVKPDWIMGPPHHPWEIVGIDHPDAIAIACAPADVAALLAEVDRRARAAGDLVAAVRAVAAWEEGTGRGDLLEALEDYAATLAGRAQAGIDAG